LGSFSLLSFFLFGFLGSVIKPVIQYRARALPRIYSKNSTALSRLPIRLQKRVNPFFLRRIHCRGHASVRGQRWAAAGWCLKRKGPVQSLMGGVAWLQSKLLLQASRPDPIHRPGRDGLREGWCLSCPKTECFSFRSVAGWE